MQSKISTSINYDEMFYVTIEGYSNYKINPDGNVKNVKTNKVLKPHLKKNGYYCVNLSRNGKCKTKYIHKLVAESFLTKYDAKHVVDHINGVKTDNRIENLRYISSSMNSRNKLSSNKIKYKFVNDLPINSLYITHVKGIDVSELNMFYNKNTKEFYMKMETNKYRIMHKVKSSKQYMINFQYNNKSISYSLKQLHREYQNYFDE